MRFAAMAVLAVMLAIVAASRASAQSSPSGVDRAHQAYVPQGTIGYRPNYRSDYTAGQVGYGSSPFEAELGTHAPRQQKYEYPVYSGRHPLGYSSTSWNRLPRGYSPPSFRATTPGYISYPRRANAPPSWASDAAATNDDRAVREAAGLQVPPSWTHAGQQLEQEMRPAAPPRFGQRVRSWLSPW